MAHQGARTMAIPFIAGSLVAGSEGVLNKGRLKQMTLFTEVRVNLETEWPSLLV